MSLPEKETPLAHALKAVDTPVDVPKIDADQIDGKVTLYVIYLLYKMNIITRYGIKEALEVIKKGTPVDLLAYLLEETKKI